MDDRFEVPDSNVKMFALAELGKVNPVILFLFKFETVIILVHFNVVGVVALKDFSEDPSIGQVTFWIGDLVGQVERLDPLV